MNKLILDKHIDTGVDTYDYDWYADGYANLIYIDTFRNSMSTIEMTPTEARKIGKQLLAFADTYDTRVAAAKQKSRKRKAAERSKKAIAKVKKNG